MLAKILLDENIPVKLKNEFAGFDVFTVSELKWNGFKNGKLLKLMEENGLKFLITLDKKIKYQQNLDKFDVKVILLDVIDPRIGNLKLLINDVQFIIDSDSESRFFSISD